MKASITNRGFVVVDHELHSGPRGVTRLIQESSAIGDYEDAYDNPGSSFLWVGDCFHLNREQVAELIGRMQHWLDNKRLKEDAR